MLAGTYNVSSLLSADYGPLEQLGELESRVYRGRGNDGRYVALRFSTVHAESARNELIDMAQAATFVQHPMLAAIGGCQSFTGGTLCIVSEYVPGQTLDRWVEENGPPSLRVTIDFVHRLCLGVNAAHQRGLIHPALRPSNLMVLQPDTQPDGRIVAKLLDLGAPAFLHAWPPKARVLPFLAPELRSATDPITPVMNVYSCGALLHYLCTGEPPPSAASDTRLPDELQRVVTNALCADPAQRTQSAAELAAELAQLESAFRSSGVYRREAAAQAARRSQSLPRVPADTGVARVPPPPTGSFPSLRIPPAQRWIVAGALAGLLALYAGWVLWTTPAPRARTRSVAPGPAPLLQLHAAAPRAPAPDIEPAPLLPAPPPAPQAQPRRAKPRAPATGLVLPPVPAAPPLGEERVAEPAPTVPEPPSTPIPVPIVAPRPVAVETDSSERAAGARGQGQDARQVQIADMSVRGSLAVSVVRRAIERIRPLLTQCYERHVPPGQPLPARLVVSATIDEVGRVRNPSVEGGALPALNACVIKATAKMDAEAPDTGTVKATWTLRI